ncbi:Acetyltransferase [Labilithrix luteola]|uniref:Acetyltransferase n=1 Tax=Labilithrix luteola TaxID=1391654 RepID=A0A0K1PY89_9BACT|nr:Acetyltransferase [Labilithrix luteola]
MLRDCDAVGEGVLLVGRPQITNGGRIEIGDGFAMSASPVRSHFEARSGGRIVVGNNVRISYGASVFAHELIEIGDNTVVGPMAMLLDVDFHEVKSRETMGEPRPIRIGKNVHIGAGVVILRGAVIGDGAHIAANSVVGRAVPPGARAAGVPARPLAPSP